MAFIVTVQLVEKSVRRSEGVVIVTRRRAQYRMDEVRCRMAMTSQAKKPSQLEVPWAATTSWAARSKAEGSTGLDALTTAETESIEAVVTASEIAEAMAGVMREMTTTA